MAEGYLAAVPPVHQFRITQTQAKVTFKIVSFIQATEESASDFHSRIEAMAYQYALRGATIISLSFINDRNARLFMEEARHETPHERKAG
jgi:hypothetical protein